MEEAGSARQLGGFLYTMYHHAHYIIKVRMVRVLGEALKRKQSIVHGVSSAGLSASEVPF